MGAGTVSAGAAVTIVGNVTCAPELRFLVGGQATVDLCVAVTRRRENPKSGAWEDMTSFLQVVCWGDLACHVAVSAKTGTRVVVTARVEQRSWQSKGRKRSKVELVAEEVALSVRFGAGSVEAAGSHGGGDADANPAA